MTNPRNAPIGKVFTRVLEIVHAAQLITTEGVAVALRPLAPGQLWPTDIDLAYAANLLGRMEKRSYVRRARPWSPGKLWAVDDEGRRVLGLFSLIRAPRKRYRTKDYHRAGSKRRRDRFRAQGYCINGGEAHAKPTRGCRCDACATVHRRSA